MCTSGPTHFIGPCVNASRRRQRLKEIRSYTKDPHFASVALDNLVTTLTLSKLLAKVCQIHRLIHNHIFRSNYLVIASSPTSNILSHINLPPASIWLPNKWETCLLLPIDPSPINDIIHATRSHSAFVF